MFRKILKISVPIILVGVIFLIAYNAYQKTQDTTESSIAVIPANASVILQLNDVKNLYIKYAPNHTFLVCGGTAWKLGVSQLGLDFVFTQDVIPELEEQRKSLMRELDEKTGELTTAKLRIAELEGMVRGVVKRASSIEESTCGAETTTTSAVPLRRRFLF